MSAEKYWIAVASAEHVRRGRAQGFMQISHGKEAPLKRIKPGDGVVYYSPTEVMGVKDGLQSFIAIGEVRQGEPYRADMGTFKPFRRDVDWAQAREAPIRPLFDKLGFTTAKSNWGYQLRLGLFEIGAKDFRLIAKAMGAEIPA